MPRFPWRRQRVGEAIGVRDVDAQPREGVGDRRLAAADAAGEADRELHGR